MYDYECDTCKGTMSVLCPISEFKETLECHEKEDCGGTLHRQYDMKNKPLVMDRDLYIARNHNGKK